MMRQFIFLGKEVETQDLQDTLNTYYAKGRVTADALKAREELKAKKKGARWPPSSRYGNSSGWCSRKLLRALRARSSASSSPLPRAP